MRSFIDKQRFITVVVYSFKTLQTVETYACAAKVHLVSLWPWPLTSDLENLFSNAHSHGEYMCQVPLKPAYMY